MTSIINRRNVLKSSIVTAAALFIPKSSILGAIAEVPPINTNRSYMAKHGNYISDSSYLWSVMKVADENQFLSFVADLLNEYNYFTKMTYSSNDKYKVEPAKRIIDAILSPETGINFYMTFLNSNPNIFTGLTPSALNQKKSNIYSKVLSNAGSTQHLIEKAEDRFGPSSSYSSKFKELHDASFEAINSKSSLMMQVNDLISGICYSIIANKMLHSSVKKEINAYFEMKTNLTTISEKNIYLPNITISKEILN